MQVPFEWRGVDMAAFGEFPHEEWRPLVQGNDSDSEDEKCIDYSKFPRDVCCFLNGISQLSHKLTCHSLPQMRIVICLDCQSRDMILLRKIKLLA